MTCGAAASLVISLKAIVEDASDEVILVAPFFPEYTVFVQNAGAKSRSILPPDTGSTSRFLSMPWNRLLRRRRGPSSSIRRTIRQASSIRLKRMKKLAALLERKSREIGHPIYLISDEPYREIILRRPSHSLCAQVFTATRSSAIRTAKSLSLPGERIGYILVPRLRHGC